jgi:NDP-sugar pyrophosphorylase family protein
MQAVILAAGKGTRLGPITKTRSKGMLPVLGKPIVERIIEIMAESGLKDFILVVGPEDRAIKEHFRGGLSMGLNIRFVDQTRRLGTTDALRQAAPHLYEDFVLSACDNIYPASDVQRLIASWSQQPDTQGLLSLERISLKDTWKTGIVTLEEDRVTSIIEKPSPDQAPTNISSTPLYCFSTRIMGYLPHVPLSPRGEYELQNAIQMMINADQLVRGLFLSTRLTLTTAEDLLELNLYFLKNEVKDYQVEAQEIGPGTHLIEPVFIEQGVVIGAGCKIGPGVYIEHDVQIGDHAQLENVVVLRGTAIPDGEILKDKVVII